MRKIAFIILTLSICLLPVPARAANYSDLNNHWAQQDVARLSARGLISGKSGNLFAPEQILTRQEAIAMLVRMKGTVTGTYGPAQSGKGVSPWAVTYMDAALQKGIINENELRVIDWGAPTTRTEMAVWLCKTLPLSPVVNDSEGIMASFKDAGNIYSYQTPYIIPVMKNGLMTGSYGFFRPGDGLKRCEAASLINRADIKFPQPGGSQMQRGQVARVDSGYHVAIVIRDAAGSEKSFMVTQQTAFYRSGRKITYSNLSAGQWVNYIVNGSQLEYAEAAGTDETSPGYTAPVLPTSLSVVGQLEKIDQNTGLIMVYSGGTQLSYRLGPYLAAGYISAKAGDEVALTVVNGWVTGITVVSIDNDDKDSSSDDNSSSGDYVIYKGTLDEADASDDEISLTSVYRLEDGHWRSRSNLQMDINGADIYYDDEDIDLEDLEDDYEGDTVYVAYDEDNDEAITIRVKKGSEYNYYDDTVGDITSSTMELDDNDKVYAYDDVMVIENGQLKDWSDIDEDDEVSATVNYTGGRYYAVIIEIMDDGENSTKSGDLIVYRGYLSEVDLDDEEIELDSVYYLGSTDWRSYSGSRQMDVSDAEIYYDEDEIDLEDLKEDHDGETVYVVYDEDAGEALHIKVREGSEYVWSDTVDSISSGSFELEDEDERIYYDDSAIVIRNDRLEEGSDIEEDDDVEVVVERQGSTYRAAVIIID
ncbi:MAG TPA: S-layer homology domain-containing protein [Syntrophomonadaceae bacterium]|nr:S-layer homology domain-containing protein [Syntrophomonadaceae bacterium]